MHISWLCQQKIDCHGRKAMGSADTPRRPQQAALGQLRGGMVQRSAHLGLVLDRLSSRLDLLGIAQVAAELQRRDCKVTGDRLQVSRQAVDKRRARGDLQARDRVVRDVLDELEDRADGVPVRGDKDSLAGLERGSDLGLPEGHHARDRVLQALGRRDLLLLEVRVLGVLAGVELAVLLDRRRRHVEAAAPDLHLVGAVLLHCLLLVEAGQAPVHPLVQAPGLGDGHVELVRLLQRVVEGLDGALEDRGVADVELEALLLDERSCALRLPDALLGEVDVDPAGEAVVHVPLRLAVAREDEQGVRLLRHGWSLGSRALR
mmetsp:Transcript_14999/g.31406  ORF Transcript_14999/g.31406 Transcript_14999/m.31406 type:complete len:318 (+) Transcript_14999:48-1001(+)